MNLNETARSLVKQAELVIPGATNDEKRAWATTQLYTLLEAHDDKIVLLGDWVQKAGGVKLVDNPISDALERWVCEQIVRIAWATLLA
ncbi:hypothetical protein [Deinococcus kurensis]|uniref:hypothetical protein n=1 Tax=Deinococcus kurensis TaxID=2662757 RepID=UPI0012D32A6C|nr:hypothetical protein [Deinococcus kurensis]